MCGLCGYASPVPQSASLLTEMNRRLIHRGPDEQGEWRQSHAEGEVALAHRRLSVLDLQHSHQPMLSADGDLALVYNGEIYNYQALRARLQEHGCVFNTEGDTEVLLHAWRQWGVGMLSQLQGMFAFALWDSGSQHLLLARDHMGVKPLYYAIDDKHFVFGSEIKAILPHPAVSRDPDLDALGLYLECQYIPAPKSIYRQIRKLPAAHAMLFRPGTGLQPEIWRYWMPDYATKHVWDEAEAAVQLEAQLRASVERMLVSDVPLGAFLSGGIDSSLVASLMIDISGGPVDTFNLGFVGQVAGSEHHEAQTVAKHIGSHHHPLMLAPEQVLRSLPAWADIFDEPFADQAALPTMLLSEHSRKHVTVVLTGEGADEIFAGYSNYAARLREEKYTAWLGARWSPLRHIAPLLPTVVRKDRFINASIQPLSRRYATIPNVLHHVLHQNLFSPAMWRAQSSNLTDYAEAAYHECNSPHYLERLLHIDARLWLADDPLTKVDRATMAHSLEARVPFLDHKLVEFCAALPPDFKLRAGHNKYLLKMVAEKYLPKTIVHRGKQGFVMPLSEWLANELKDAVHTALSQHGLARRGLFGNKALERLLLAHYGGRKNHAGRLWTLLVLENWFSHHLPDFQLD